MLAGTRRAMSRKPLVGPQFGRGPLISGGRCDRLPRGHRTEAMKVSGQRRAIGAGRNEVVADGGEGGDEPLPPRPRPEALRHSLPLSDGDVGVFGAAVQPLGLAMPTLWRDRTLGGAVGPALVAYDPPRGTTSFLRKTAQRPPRSLGVSVDSHDLVEDIIVLIDGAPGVAFLAVGGDDDLVEIPDVMATVRSRASSDGRGPQRTSKPIARSFHRRRGCRVQEASPRRRPGSRGNGIGPDCVRDSLCNLLAVTLSILFVVLLDN